MVVVLKQFLNVLSSLSNDPTVLQIFSAGDEEVVLAPILNLLAE